MSKIIIRNVDKKDINLICSICGNEHFENYKVINKIVAYADSDHYYRDGYNEIEMEQFTCNKCGWSTLFKNDYDIDLNDDRIKIE